MCNFLFVIRTLDGRAIYSELRVSGRTAHPKLMRFVNIKVWAIGLAIKSIIFPLID